MLVGSNVTIIGRQDVAADAGSTCCTYGITGHVLDLAEPADSPRPPRATGRRRP